MPLAGYQSRTVENGGFTQAILTSRIKRPDAYPLRKPVPPLPWSSPEFSCQIAIKIEASFAGIVLGLRLGQRWECLTALAIPQVGEVQAQQIGGLVNVSTMRALPSRQCGRRLSAEEAQNLPPVGRRYLAQFAKALDEAIQSTAEDAGVLDEYNAAIKEYRQGMNLNNAWEWGKSMVKSMAEKAIQNAPWVGGAYAIARKYLP